MPDIQTYLDVLPTARHQGDVLILTLQGEIDLHTSPDLRTTLLSLIQQTQAKTLIFVLSGVPYMDSSAIAVLVEILQRVRKTQGKVVLVDLQPRVKGLLEIARLNTIFNIASTLDEALKLP